MTDEPQPFVVDAAKWDEMLAKQMNKQAAKMPTRAKVPSSRPYPEKSFVTFHYNALGEPGHDTQYGNRDPSVYVVMHFFMRDGDTFSALCSDARNYVATMQHSHVVVHSHRWDQPCSAAPKQQKCKGV